MIRAADNDAVKDAGALLRAGKLVAFPTETVYGLGADATDDAAVAAIYAAKGRPQFNPLIVHVADMAAAEPLVEIGETARKLARAFWPGPLTLVLPRKSSGGLSLLVSAGLDSVAIRSPDHPVARALLAAAGRPVAAPSANRSTEVSPTTAQHVAESFDGIENGPALILDGGATAVGIESTVIDLSGQQPTLLRPGGVTLEQLEAVIGPVARADHRTDLGDAPRPSPGMMARHYAPRCPVRLNASSVTGSEALLAFGPPLPGAAQTLNLSARGDLSEAAANLFAMLRVLDKPGFSAIAVMPIPDEGLGLAINDRLARAATPA
ncbi:MAG TPA: L-threonylcarbamoyladenylate synthase [Alphaproteobacteria bacterium]|nr:L-threonylcarbamoyladenylate synthase [Alphaproteobacteria bacterium]